MKNKQLNKKVNDKVTTPDSLGLGSSVVDYVNDSLKTQKATRRDFLKTMGFSISAAAIAASCEAPIIHSLPYVNKPAELTPGKALYYASTFFDGARYADIVVKNRDGRPIKISGNYSSNLTKGSTGAIAQASLMSLYDYTRLQFPYINGEQANWEDAISNLKSDLQKVSGKKVLLTGPIISPSLKKLIAELNNNLNVEHIVYSPVKHDALLLANQEDFGKAVAPFYDFEKADVVASFSADFLGNWLNGENFFSVDYGKRRKVGIHNTDMNKHYQVDTHMSQTGSNADKRISVKPSELDATVFQLNKLLGGSSYGAPAATGKVLTFLKELAKDLQSSKGRSIVVSGSNNLNVQRAVNEINVRLGNYGQTINLDKPIFISQGVNKDFLGLLNDMKAGQVGAFLGYNANPAYDSPLANTFKAGLEKVKLKVSFDSHANETNKGANYLLPSSHYLESWGDYIPVPGHFAIGQPVIETIFDTKEFGQSLLSILGDERSYYEYIKSNYSGDWNNTVKNGFVSHSESLPIENIAVSTKPITYKAPKAGNGLEVVLFEDKLGNGMHSNNPQLQELPDGVSKVAWGNYAAISPATHNTTGWGRDRNNRPGQQNSTIVSITANNKTIEVPVLVLPGIPNGVLAVPVGYGREIAGLVGTKIGANGHKIASVSAENGLVNDYVFATVEDTGNREEIPQTQFHYTIPEDRSIVKETTLAAFKEDPESGNFDRYLPEYQKAFGEDVTLYPEYQYQGHKWGMSIDLNSCFGCGSCVVSCNIENNVPVVGKDEVQRSREMHWLRIDRYFASENNDPKSENYMEDPSTVFMPMMCQHCDNAPCENVCPVNATNHSSEGLNQMSYNRCIGTRYCANNCPFKVRRFNWFDYWGADSFGDVNDLDKDAVSENMRDDISRMVLNPDVTVRSRGVIEKCSFCVQRIQEAKLDAKIAGQPLEAGAVVTACQDACPTNAIIFGDVNNQNSEVYKELADVRNYYVLEEFHVLPSVGYKTKVTNSDKALFDHLPNGHFHKAEHGSGPGHGTSTDGHGENPHRDIEKNVSDIDKDKH